MPTWIVVLLFVLLVARVTRLVNADLVTDPVRLWVARRTGPHSTPSYFLACAWCVSVWVGVVFGAVLVWWQDWSWWALPLVAGGASMVSGLLSRWDDDPVEIVDE